MKKVLLLTYYWPPGSGPGVQRWLKFCKYLPQFGIEPTVITVKNGSYPNEDTSLEKDIPRDLHVIKTETFEPFAIYNLLRGKKGKAVEVGLGNLKNKPGLFSQFANYIRANFFIPDARVGWNRYSYQAALKAMGASKPDVIITTGPPHSTHLVGQQLQKEHQLKWVADFRDPWTTIYYNALLNRTPSSKAKDQRLEDSVLANCDLLIVPTPGMAKEFEGRAKKIAFIPNGYDSDDFKSNDISIFSDKLIISYTGNFKENQNLEHLWHALKAVKQLHPECDIQFQFTGNVHPAILESIAQVGIADQVIVNPFVDHAKAIELMKRSHVLLLPIPNSSGNELILTGKIFEYLAARRPILSIGPTSGNASKILDECGHLPMLDYDAKDEMQSRLEEYWGLHQTAKLQKPAGNDRYKNYSRMGLTEQLSEQLNQL